MSKKVSVKSADLSLMSVPAFWPMAMATAMLEEGTELYAKNVKFAEEEIKIHDELRPTLATPNQVRIDLRTMVLRDYGKPGGLPTLVDAPHAGHTAMIADYHKGQSLVETLLANGIGQQSLDQALAFMIVGDHGCVTGMGSIDERGKSARLAIIAQHHGPQIKAYLVRSREGGSQLVMNFDFFLNEFEVLRVKLRPFLDQLGCHRHRPERRHAH